MSWNRSLLASSPLLHPSQLRKVASVPSRQLYFRTSRMAAASSSGTTGQTLDGRRAQLAEMVEKLSKQFPEVGNISAKQLHSMLGDPPQKIVVLDVRTPDEVAVSMIPGALSEAEFERGKEQWRGHCVVCYCTVGFRSSQTARRLQQEGFDARNLEGSIVAWTQEGYPLVVPAAGSQRVAEGSGPEAQVQQPTKRVHVFGKQWALQGEGYEAVMFSHPFVEYAKAAARKALPSWLGGGR